MATNRLTLGGVQTTPFVVNGPSIQDTVDGTLVQTTDATPTVLMSFPIDILKGAYIEVFLMVIEQTFSAGAVANVQCLFARIQGNLVRVTVPTGNVVTTTFTAPQPALDLVANTTTNSIDLIGTGKVGMTLRWYVETRLRVTQ